MYADHYTVPPELKIKLVGTVRWKTTREGHWVISLWRTPDGRAHYCQEVYRPWSVPFWMATRMSDLVECDVLQFEAYIETVEAMIPEGAELESFTHRTEELFCLWGYLDGVDQAIEEEARRARDE